MAAQVMYNIVIDSRQSTQHLRHKVLHTQTMTRETTHYFNRLLLCYRSNQYDQ